MSLKATKRQINPITCRRTGYKSHLTLPVKLTPAKCGELVMTSPNTGPSAGTKLMTPAGRPASLKMLYTT